MRFDFLAAYHLFFIKLNDKIFVSILKLKLNVGGSHDSKSTFGAKFGPQSKRSCSGFLDNSWSVEYHYICFSKIVHFSVKTRMYWSFSRG